MELVQVVHADKDFLLYLSHIEDPVPIFQGPFPVFLKRFIGHQPLPWDVHARPPFGRAAHFAFAL